MIELNKDESDFTVYHLQENVVRSFMFADPDKNPPTENRYCVGIKYANDPLDIENWTFDHANYWDADNDPKMENTPAPVTRERLEEVLSRHSTTFKDLMRQILAWNPDTKT